MRFAWQVGQSVHPRPDWVRRTAPPVTTINPMSHTATNVTRR